MLALSSSQWSCTPRSLPAMGPRTGSVAALQAVLSAISLQRAPRLEPSQRLALLRKRRRWGSPCAARLPGRGASAPAARRLRAPAPGSPPEEGGRGGGGRREQRLALFWRPRPAKERIPHLSAPICSLLFVSIVVTSCWPGFDVRSGVSANVVPGNVASCCPGFDVRFGVQNCLHCSV